MELKTFSPQKIEFTTHDFKILVSTRTNPVSAMSPAFHEAIEIKYFFDGDFALMINSNVIIANSNDITIVNPYEIHSNLNINGYNGKYHMIIIDIDSLSDFGNAEFNLRQLLIEDKFKFANHIKNNATLNSLFLRIVDETNSQKPYYKTVVKNLISEFFIVLLRDYLCNQTKPLATDKFYKQKKLISPALSKIHSDYQKKLTTEELADCCNLSKYYFCRIFKLAMDMPAFEYIMKHRVNVAETLLKTTNDSVAEIGWSCGFESESYFCRCYKKIKGHAPKAIRKISKI